MKIAVTGASSGLGWQLALGLADKGKELLLFGRDFSRLSQLKVLVESRGAITQLCVADLLHRDGIGQTIAALAEFRPELLVQCAGIGRYGHFCDVEVEASLDILRLNVLAVMETTHAWATCMKRDGSQITPKVVFISSSAAFLPMPGMSAYAASKACLLSFAEGLRFEEEGKIDVLTVCPGHFATNFQKRAALLPLGEPSTEEARHVAEQIIKALHKKGVYIPFPWNCLLFLKRFIPKRFLMKLIEKRALFLRQR